MIITKTISTVLDSLSRRIVKVLRFGIEDNQTGIEASPYGTDSNPIKGMRAVYADTGEKGRTVIVGYLNLNQLADVGEHRIYSTDDAGALKFSIWLKNDGTCEIGGNTKHLVRFEELETAFNELKSKFNSHVHTGVTTGGGSSGTTPTPSTADISGAKIEELKTL